MFVMFENSNCFEDQRGKLKKKDKCQPLRQNMAQVESEFMWRQNDPRCRYQVYKLHILLRVILSITIGLKPVCLQAIHCSLYILRYFLLDSPSNTYNSPSVQMNFPIL